MVVIQRYNINGSWQSIVGGQFVTGISDLSVSEEGPDTLKLSWTSRYGETETYSGSRREVLEKTAEITDIREDGLRIR